MKRIGNIYDKICDINVIRDMYFNEVARTTKNKRKIEGFSNYLSLNLVNIRNMLVNKNVVFDDYIVFLVWEPKYRLIMSQTIKDKIINHLVAHYFVLDVFDKSLIESNVATRVGYGTKKGIIFLKKYINEIKIKNEKIYYLKCDIDSYFYNIDHEVLKEKIKIKIKDEKALKLIYQIIDSTNNKKLNEKVEYVCNKEIDRINGLNISKCEKELKIKSLEKIKKLKFDNTGIPIGNMTSQGFSIIYLNDFDHYVKEKLQQKYYVRYMDDFICLSTNKDELKKIKLKIEHVLEDEFKLKLNNKTMISSLDKGLYFLGYIFKLQNNKLYIRLNSRVKRQFKRKIKKFKNKNSIDAGYILNVIGSYKGHLKYGNAYYLYKHALKGIDMDRLKIENRKNIKNMIH